MREKLIRRKGFGICERVTGMKRTKLTMYMHKAVKALKTQRQKQKSAIVRLYFSTHTHIHTVVLLAFVIRKQKCHAPPAGISYGAEVR